MSRCEGGRGRAALLPIGFRDCQVRDSLASIPELRGVALVFRGMGFREGSEDLELFRRAVLEARLAAPESLLLRSALAEARTMSDPAGNVKMVRSVAAHGRRFRAKDDALSALVLSVAEGERMRRCPPSPRPSNCRGRGR